MNKEGRALIVNGRKMKDTLVVSIRGELDHHTAETIRDQMDKLLDDPTIKNMIVDAKDLSFMDSSGIGVFIGRYKRINRRGGKVAIVNVSAHVDKILEVSGLYKIINVYSSIQEALDDIRGV